MPSDIDHSPYRASSSGDAGGPDEGHDRELRDLADFARLITFLSGRFVNAHSSGLNAEINNALAQIGGFAGVDRSYVFQFSADGSRFGNTHEWCAEGVEPAIERLRDVAVTDFAWPMERYKRGEGVYVDDVTALPPEADSLRDELIAQGVRSMITVPLVCAGKVLGFLGFDAVRSCKTWGTETISLLKVTGEIMAGAMERERALDLLTRQARLEMLVARISTRFLNLPMEGLSDEVDRALAEIASFTGVDRCYVFQLNGSGRTMDNTHEWCAPGIEPHLDRLKGLPVDAFPYSMEIMHSGAIFHVANVADLPDAAAGERKEFEKEGIKTLINVPIMVRNRMIGFLGFDAVNARKEWSEADFRLLKLVAEILAGALERQRVQQCLEDSLEEKDVLLREIHHRVKNNLQVVHSLLYLQGRALGESAGSEAFEAFRQSRIRIKAMATIHDRLYRSMDLAHVDFDDYLQVLVPDLARLYPVGKRVEVALDTRPLRLSIDQAVPCGLVVSELVVNALKHAFPEGRSGRLQVALTLSEGDVVCLSVCDDGVGLDTAAMLETGRSLGWQLVNDLVNQLEGELAVESHSGTCITLRFGKK